LLLDLNKLKDNFMVKAEPLSFTGDSMGGGPDKGKVQGKKSKLISALKTSLDNSPLPETAYMLKSNLQKSALFVIPGQGTFSYEDPMFNDKGDLFTGISYKS
jgi:hypothetical protein